MANYKVLSDELANDPRGRGFAAMSDAEAAADLNAANIPTIVSPTWASARTILASVDPAIATTILEKLEAAATSSPMIKWVMRFMTSDGIDVGYPSTREQINGLVTAGVLTQAEADALLAIAETEASWAAQNGWSTVQAEDVARVR